MIESIQKIIGLLEDRKVLKGEYIFKAGDHDPYFYILASGKIEINISTKSGKSKSLGIVNSGEFFGEGALSSHQIDQIRPVNAVALEDAHLLILHRDKFKTLMQNDPETAASFLYKILELTYKRLRFANEELLTLYEVGRLIGVYLDDFEVLIREILEQILETTHSEKALMLSFNKLTRRDEIIGQIGDFQDLKIEELKKKDFIYENNIQESVKYGLPDQKLLLAQIPDMGFILLTRSNTKKDYRESHLKLLISVAEQAKAAIERATKIRDQKAKDLYNKRKIQYNF